MNTNKPWKLFNKPYAQSQHLLQAEYGYHKDSLACIDAEAMGNKVRVYTCVRQFLLLSTPLENAVTAKKNDPPATYSPPPYFLSTSPHCNKLPWVFVFQRRSF